MLEKLLHVEELHAKTLRGSTTVILAPTQTFIIKDTIGFERFMEDPMTLVSGSFYDGESRRLMRSVRSTNDKSC